MDQGVTMLTDVPPSTATHRETAGPLGLYLLAGCAMASCIALIRFPSTLDDAFITYHYARNFAQGHILGTWNVGEAPVEGCSSLLWTLILGWGIRWGLSPFYLSKTIGFLSALAMPLAAFFAFSKARQRPETPEVDVTALACASIILSLWVPLFFYSVTGMETTFFSLQVLLLLLLPFMVRRLPRTILNVIISSVLVLTRPEGIVVAGIINGFWLFDRPRRKLPSCAVAGLAAAALAFAGLTIFRFHRFHEFVPNTYFAKATGGRASHRLLLGSFYVVRFFELTLPAWIITAGLLINGRRRFHSGAILRLLLLLASCYTLYIIKVGGDPSSAFPLRRHFVHIAGVIALLLGELIARSSKSLRSAQLSASILTAATATWVLVGWCIGPLHESISIIENVGLLHTAPMSPSWEWLRRYSFPDTLTAVLGAGEWPFYVPGRYIDMLGLNDAHIAKFGKVDPHSRFQDSKSDMRYVLSRQPDIIDGYVDPISIIQGRCPLAVHSDREQMMHDMLNDPEFQQDYVFVVNGPYDSLAKAIFFRADYAKKVAGAELLTVSVRRTALYAPGCN